jgi:sugar (pentulose or hexulose) kinase
LSRNTWKMKRSFALLDVGGTDIKSCIANIEDSCLQEIYRTKTPGNIQKSKNMYEIDPVELLREVESHIHSIKSTKLKITALVISGQMGSWIVSDTKNNPVTNLISWQDNRAALNKINFDQQMIEKLGADWLQKSGNEMRAGLPLLGLESMKKNLPLKENLRLHTLISWVSSQLSEDYVYLSHITDSASTGMLDITSQTWSTAAINFLDFDIQVPKLAVEMSVIGYSRDLSCSIYAPVGDQQASLYGAELGSENTVVNIGTGGQVAAISNSHRSSDLQMRPYFNGKNIETRTHLPAGRLITKCVHTLFPNQNETEAFAYFLQQSEEFESAEYLEINVLQKEDFLSLDNQKFLPSIILNSIAEVYRSALLEINGKSVKNLIFAGGVGQKFKRLQKAIASGKNYEIAKSEETTLRGLMLLSKTL